MEVAIYYRINSNNLFLHTQNNQNYVPDFPSSKNFCSMKISFSSRFLQFKIAENERENVSSANTLFPLYLKYFNQKVHPCLSIYTSIYLCTYVESMQHLKPDIRNCILHLYHIFCYRQPEAICSQKMLRLYRQKRTYEILTDEFFL